MDGEPSQSYSHLLQDPQLNEASSEGLVGREGGAAELAHAECKDHDMQAASLAIVWRQFLHFCFCSKCL